LWAVGITRQPSIFSEFKIILSKKDISLRNNTLRSLQNKRQPFIII